MCLWSWKDCEILLVWTVASSFKVKECELVKVSLFRLHMNWIGTVVSSRKLEKSWELGKGLGMFWFLRGKTSGFYFMHCPLSMCFYVSLKMLTHMIVWSPWNKLWFNKSPMYLSTGLAIEISRPTVWPCLRPEFIQVAIWG